MGIVIILARLLDLRFEVFLVLLRGLKTCGSGLSLALRARGLRIGLFDGRLRGGNLGIGQFVKLNNLVRQILANTGKLSSQLRLTLRARGFLVLGVHQIAIRVVGVSVLNHRRIGSNGNGKAQRARKAHRANLPDGFALGHHSFPFVTGPHHIIVS